MVASLAPAPRLSGRGSRRTVRLATRTASHSGNALLDALLSARTDALARLAERVVLERGTTLHRAGNPLPWVYFPAGAVISLQLVLENGCMTELCPVGADAMAGLAGCLSAAALCLPQLVVTAGGTAYRARTRTLRHALQQRGPAQDMLLRYAQSECNRIAQLSACACLHCTEQRVARWLLDMGAAGAAAQIDITHDQLALLLGVRRESITEALCRLRARGVLHTSRGRLIMVRPEALGALACGCHALLQQERQHLQADLHQLAERARHAARRHFGLLGGAMPAPVLWQSRR